MFGPASSPYKVSHSGTESAVVLQCLMLLAAFLTPLGRRSKKTQHRTKRPQHRPKRTFEGQKGQNEAIQDKRAEGAPF